MALTIPRDELESVLQRHVLDVWYPRCIDHEYGGFLCDFDRRWQPCGPHDKMLEFQARQTWLAADALREYPDDERLRQATEHGLQYLQGPLWDAEHGGWYHMLDRAGAPLENHTKHAHGIAYGIAASAAVAKVTGEPAALELARAGFEWLDAHAHDTSHGGYFGLLTRDGKIVRHGGTAAWPDEFDQIGTPLGYKDANVHSDLLEGLTLLHAVWPNARVAERLAEIVAFIAEKMSDADGGLRYLAHPDGRPLNRYVQYGHVLQSSHRLLAARRQLGQPELGLEDARRFLAYALTHGLDREHGGFHHANSDAPNAPRARSKQWWVQAEGLRALILVDGVGPDEPRFANELSAHWSYLRQFLFDERYGGIYFESIEGLPRWRRALGAHLAPAHFTRKGSVWKYCGHEGHALLAGLRDGSNPH